MQDKLFSVKNLKTTHQKVFFRYFTCIMSKNRKTYTYAEVKSKSFFRY